MSEKVDCCDVKQESGHTMHMFPLRRFVDEGLLQEVNRVVLHPLGLALTAWEDDGEITHLGVVETTDPAGIMFRDIDQSKMRLVQDGDEVLCTLVRRKGAA